MDGAKRSHNPYLTWQTVYPFWGKYDMLINYNEPEQCKTDIAQYKPGSTEPAVTDSLVFQLEAYAGIGNKDGDGIKNVDMRITGPDGVQVHQRTEYNAGYCAFGGGSPNCNHWVFSDHNNEWPGGQPLQYGFHTLQATVNTNDGRSEIWETTIEIRDPTASDSSVLTFLPLIVK